MRSSLAVSQFVDAINSVDIDQTIRDLLGQLGKGKTNSVPYDTGWAARLERQFPGNRFNQSLDWLRRHQHSDGSWGSDLLHYHDRYVSTLSAVVALQEHQGSFADGQRIERGVRYLWDILGRLQTDAMDTIAFPLLAMTLEQEARSIGLNVPSAIYARERENIQYKLKLLGENPKLWHKTTMSFSLEGVFPYFNDAQLPEAPSFQFADGSVGGSPASTAAFLQLAKGTAQTRAFDYLNRELDRQLDGGLSNLHPLELFERTWSLYPLALAGAISPDDPTVRQHLEVLHQAWQPGKGMVYHQYFPEPDLDDTAVAFSLLHWGGYDISPSVFRYFEDEAYFYCYQGESDPSLSANIRLLQALEQAEVLGDYPEWQAKIESMLVRYGNRSAVWFDKWHISPYYLASTALTVSNDTLAPFLAAHVDWILNTQQADGGWGFYGRSTAEETAYALLGLLVWQQKRPLIPRHHLQAAASFLVREMDAPRPAMYIGKCLFCPELVVNSTILSALYLYLHQS